MCGFGGMRDYGGDLSFDPRLPESWPSLSFPLQWQGTAMQVSVTRHELRVQVRSGPPVPFSVRDNAYIATLEDDVIVPLANQGPVIPGRPTLQEFADARRDDGTRLSASVPVITSAIPSSSRSTDRRPTPLRASHPVADVRNGVVRVKEAGSSERSNVGGTP